jgi:hypothetical protein
MQRALIQLLAVVIITILGGLAYLRLNSTTSPVSSATSNSPAPVPTTSGPANTPPTATATAATAATSAGWGQTMLYVGDYRLTASSNASLARTGTLTIALDPSATAIRGVLSLPPADQTSGSYLASFYLTNFAHSGMVRSATINLGSYTGPAVGAFVVNSYTNNMLVARVTFQGEPSLTLRFDHYSVNP